MILRAIFFSALLAVGMGCESTGNNAPTVNDVAAAAALTSEQASLAIFRECGNSEPLPRGSCISSSRISTEQALRAARMLFEYNQLSELAFETSVMARQVMADAQRELERGNTEEFQALRTQARGLETDSTVAKREAEKRLDGVNTFLAEQGVTGE